MPNPDHDPVPHKRMGVTGAELGVDCAEFGKPCVAGETRLELRKIIRKILGILL